MQTKFVWRPTSILPLYIQSYISLIQGADGKVVNLKFLHVIQSGIYRPQAQKYIS